MNLLKGLTRKLGVNKTPKSDQLEGKIQKELETLLDTHYEQRTKLYFKTQPSTLIIGSIALVYYYQDDEKGFVGLRGIYGPLLFTLLLRQPTRRIRKAWYLYQAKRNSSKS